MIAREPLQSRLKKYREACTRQPIPRGSVHRQPASVHRFPVALRRAQCPPPVAQRRGVIVRLHINTFEQAVLALVLMKNEEQAYIDVAQDDRTISLLMKITHTATEKVMITYLRGRYSYPSESVISQILEDLENTGVFGAGQ